MNKRVPFLLTLLIVSAHAFAQRTFSHRAQLPKIDSAGFYTIRLTPDILAHGQSGLADIRLFDGQKFTPYFFGSELPAKNKKIFVEFPGVSTNSKTDTATVFVVENSAHFIVNQLYLQLRNMAVKRTINLSGSDDLNSWFAIEENVALASASSANDKEIDEQFLNLPYSNYRYFKIQVAHKNKEPIAILRAGTYKGKVEASEYLQLPPVEFMQKDSARSSIVVIRCKDSYPVNKIHLYIASPKFYKRKVNIYQLSGKYFRLTHDTVISSSEKPDLTFSAKTTAIKLEIFNEDNPPLRIQTIITYQLSQKIVAYLDKEKSYQVLVGDSTADAPNYDLKFFADSLQRDLPKLTPTGVEVNPLHQQVAKKKAITIPPWAIWLAIIAVTLVLVMLTLKMTKEVNKRDG